MIKQPKYTNVSLLAGLLVLVLASLVFQPTSLNAQGTPLPTATPWGTPAPTQVAPSAEGGTLILQAYNAPAAGWTVVQWQDANGGWHDVAGWQSQLTNGYVGWWVDPGNFAEGPFRWVMLASENGEMVDATEAFSLPGYSGDVVLVEMRLD